MGYKIEWYMENWNGKDRPKISTVSFDFDDEDTLAQEWIAEEIAEEMHSEMEYPDEMKIFLRKPGTEKWDKFIVSVESVPSFSAEKENPPHLNKGE